MLLLPSHASGHVIIFGRYRANSAAVSVRGLSFNCCHNAISSKYGRISIAQPPARSGGAGSGNFRWRDNKLFMAVFI